MYTQLVSLHVVTKVNGRNNTHYGNKLQLGTTGPAEMLQVPAEGQGVCMRFEKPD